MAKQSHGSDNSYFYGTHVAQMPLRTIRQPLLGPVAAMRCALGVIRGHWAAYIRDVSFIAETDMFSVETNVCYVPKADIDPLSEELQSINAIR